jgi:hypothetical protein
MSSISFMLSNLLDCPPASGRGRLLIMFAGSTLISESVLRSLTARLEHTPRFVAMCKQRNVFLRNLTLWLPS